MDDFIWHKVSEKEKIEIQTKAKKIMEDFGRKLEKISAPEAHFSVDDGLREQGKPWKTSEEFRDTILSNAPDAASGFIIAEKGGWKK